MREVLEKRWNEVGEKIIRLAEEFPAAKLDERPAVGARSFAEQLRHVAFWNRWVGETLRGASPSGDANELSREEAPTREKLLAALADSFADVGRELGAKKKNPPDLDTVVAFLEHNGEHYGQLAVYSRLAGVVPPASR